MTRDEIQQFKSELEFTLFTRSSGSYNVAFLEKVLAVIKVLEKDRDEALAEDTRKTLFVAVIKRERDEAIKEGLALTIENDRLRKNVGKMGLVVYPDSIRQYVTLSIQREGNRLTIGLDHMADLRP